MVRQIMPRERGSLDAKRQQQCRPNFHSSTERIADGAADHSIWKRVMAMEATQRIETLLVDVELGVEQRSRLLDASLWAGIPEENVGKAFADTALAHETKIALVTASRTSTYGQLLAAAIEVRDRLWKSPSFALGSRVLLLLPNSREYIVACYGTMLAGGVVVPDESSSPNPESPGHGLKHSRTTSTSQSNRWLFPLVWRRSCSPAGHQVRRKG
jgi:non-ribosomal peptide synthetase component F